MKRAINKSNGLKYIRLTKRTLSVNFVQCIRLGNFRCCHSIFTTKHHGCHTKTSGYQKYIAEDPIYLKLLSDLGDEVK